MYGLVKTAAGDPIISDAELQAEARVDACSDDDMLTFCGTAAQDHCETLSGRSFTLATYTWTLDRFPCGVFQLPRTPAKEIDSITYIDVNGDSQTLDPSAYILDASTGRVQAAFGTRFPYTRCQIGAVVIVFKAGFDATTEPLPPMLKKIVLKFAATLYQFRELLSNTAISDIPVPFNLGSLLAPYSDIGFGV